MPSATYILADKLKDIENKSEYYVLKFMRDEKNELARIRCEHYQILSKIKHDMEEAKKNTSDLGRPLTI